MYLLFDKCFSFDASVLQSSLMFVIPRRAGSHVMAHNNHIGEELLLDDPTIAHVESQVNLISKVIKVRDYEAVSLQHANYLKRDKKTLIRKREKMFFKYFSLIFKTSFIFCSLH